MSNRKRVTDASLITGRLDDTPEGFLICRDVPLARTGDQVYADYEVRGIPPKNGQVIAQRDEDQVFHPDAIASFRGKPLTDDHPDDDVTTANFKQYLIGTVMSPRRGEGAFAHCVVGDLIVYDPKAIAKIKAGKRELSCGYDADYESIEPGRARQINIRGNHVSLVDEGRCGEACAIRDKAKYMPATTTKRPWFDNLRKAFSAKDDAEREGHLTAAEAAMPGDEGDHEGDGHHIVLNINGVPGADPDTKPKEAESGKEGELNEGKDMDEDKVNEMIATAVGAAVAKAAEDNAAAIKKAVDDATAPLLAKIDDLADAMGDMTDPDDMGTQDAVARAEILAPGLTRPTTDAKPGSKPHRDAMGGFQRDALKKALTTDEGRAVVGAVLGYVSSHRIAAMPTNEVAVAFRAASQIMLDHNAASTVSTLESATAGYVRDDAGNRKVFDNKTWNDINAKHFARKA